jgi:hypothetical protein
VKESDIVGLICIHVVPSLLERLNWALVGLV